MMFNDYLKSIFSLEGKTALVTGAGGSLGGVIARALHSAGANVALCDMNSSALMDLQGELGDLGTIMIRMNMLDFDGFSDVAREAAEINGRIDILVNCAAVNIREALSGVEEEDFDIIMDVNFKGTFFLAKAVVSYMKAQRSGSIINFGSSETGMAYGGFSVHGASKSAIVSLTRSMAVEWGGFNIRANCISPGHFKTPMTLPIWEHPERSRYILERIALGRAGVPADLAGLAIYLASDASSYVTGAEFRIDGGCMAGGKPFVAKS